MYVAVVVEESIREPLSLAPARRLLHGQNTSSGAHKALNAPGSQHVQVTEPEDQANATEPLFLCLKARLDVCQVSHHHSVLSALQLAKNLVGCFEVASWCLPASGDVRLGRCLALNMHARRIFSHLLVSSNINNGLQGSQPMLDTY